MSDTQERNSALKKAENLVRTSSLNELSTYFGDYFYNCESKKVKNKIVVKTHQNEQILSKNEAIDNLCTLLQNSDYQLILDFIEFIKTN